MRFGTTATSIKTMAEERRQARKVLSDEAQELSEAEPAAVYNININDTSGNNRGVFVLGLHNPYDANTTRWFPGT